MTFEEILDQAIAMLQRCGRMTYRTLQRQFALDEEALNDLKAELLHWQALDPSQRRQHTLVETGQATTHYHQALALAEKLGMRPLQAHCHLGLGTLYAATAQREHAHTELATATELYRTMEMTFWMLQAEAALAQVEEQ